ncbi:MAG: DUF4126 domain-containing protein [Gammaproteobacteria bacterium]|nr:DUF4126 domain-containing protein [Gammaproteobacteria bacterium]MBQ0839418.1 DUF4126 domain-containing protein [Gammaproteobacteria bacterium]
MDTYQQLISTLALVMGVGWASGINLYAAVAVLGIAGASGNIELPAGLETLQDPLVIGIACLMYVVEFFADKTPGVDTAWDTLHTFIRIPAGALLAAGAVGDVTPAFEIGAGLVGGSMAMGSHLTKASTRLLINTSPEPFSNWGASISEDLLVFGGLWAMLNQPGLFLGLMLVFIVLVIWLLPKLWRVVCAVFRRIGGWLGIVKKQPADAADGRDALLAGAAVEPVATQAATSAEPAPKPGIGSPFKDR